MVSNFFVISVVLYLIPYFIPLHLNVQTIMQSIQMKLTRAIYIYLSFGEMYINPGCEKCV